MHLAYSTSGLSFYSPTVLPYKITSRCGARTTPDEDNGNRPLLSAFLLPPPLPDLIFWPTANGAIRAPTRKHVVQIVHSPLLIELCLLTDELPFLLNPVCFFANFLPFLFILHGTRDEIDQIVRWLFFFLVSHLSTRF